MGALGQWPLWPYRRYGTEYIEIPKEIKRLNSKFENDSLAKAAFERLSECSKILCSKQINNFTENIASSIFKIQLKYANAHLMTTNIRDGTINKTDVGTNIFSNSMLADFICPPEILDEKTKNNNLVKTKIVATPRTYTKIKFNYVLSTSGSIGGSVSCEYSTGDKSGETREIK